LSEAHAQRRGGDQRLDLVVEQVLFGGSALGNRPDPGRCRRPPGSRGERKEIGGLRRAGDGSSV